MDQFTVEGIGVPVGGEVGRNPVGDSFDLSLGFIVGIAGSGNDVRGAGSDDGFEFTDIATKDVEDIIGELPQAGSGWGH